MMFSTCFIVLFILYFATNGSLDAAESRRPNELNKIVSERAAQKSEKQFKQINAYITISSEINGVSMGSIDAQELVSAPQGATALDFLLEASKRNNCFRSRLKKTKWGPMIIGICDVEQDIKKEMYWFFKVNGEMMPIGAGSYVVKEKDNILFLYKKYEKNH